MIKSKVRLFVDDAALYLTSSTSSQSEILQKDLDTLERSSHKWDMEFNPSNCQVIQITRSKNPIPTQYTFHNCILESVSLAKYLGVDISSDISWDTHTNRISKKHLAFLGETSRFTPNRFNLLTSCSSSVRVLLHSLVSIHRFKYL